jgi:hypothetical protein
MGTRYLGARVICYAGYRGEEEPRRFSWGEEEREVVEILDRWLDPRHRYFKVRAGDDRYYLLRHAVESEFWELRELGDRPWKRYPGE